jgi:hypothetical protein
MAALKDISDATKVMISFVVLIVILLIIYGIIKLTGAFGNLGNDISKTAGNAGNVAANVSGAASNITTQLFGTGNVPAPIPGSWQKLIAGQNPLEPSTWTGPTSDSTTAAAIQGFITALNNLPGNHWYDALNLGEDLSNMLGNAPPQIIGVFASMPSQADIYQAVSGYNTQYSDDIYNGLISSLDSSTQDSLATVILAKPLTV